MIRWALHVLFALLLALSAVAAWGWAVPPHGSEFRFATKGRSYEWMVWGGRRRVFSLETISGSLGPNGKFHYDWMDSSWQTTHRLPLGVSVGLRPRDHPKKTSYFRVVAPCWVVVAATGAPPVVWFGLRGLTYARKRRRAAGALKPCPTCGYDLRGGHERCPECGESVG